MSLADAIAITCSVQHDVNMQMIGVRRISARTKHGREPSTRGSPDRVNDVPHRFISVGLYGNEFAVGEIETRDVDGFAYRMGAELARCGAVAVAAFVSGTRAHGL